MAESKGVFDRADAKRIKTTTFYGQDLVPRPRRLALMNLFPLTNRQGSRPRKTDVGVAKNHLEPPELEALNRNVMAYLEFAELRALDHRPMYTGDWVSKLEDFLRLGVGVSSSYPPPPGVPAGLRMEAYSFLKRGRGIIRPTVAVPADLMEVRRKIKADLDQLKRGEGIPGARQLRWASENPGIEEPRATRKSRENGARRGPGRLISSEFRRLIRSSSS